MYPANGLALQSEHDFQVFNRSLALTVTRNCSCLVVIDYVCVYSLLLLCMLCHYMSTLYQRDCYRLHALVFILIALRHKICAWNVNIR